MPLLSTTERQQVWRGLMRYWSRELHVLVPDQSKNELFNLVVDTDVWQQNEQANFIASLATSAQTLAGNDPSAIAFVFAVVALAKYGDVDAVKRLLMVEVD